MARPTNDRPLEPDVELEVGWSSHSRPHVIVGFRDGAGGIKEAVTPCHRTLRGLVASVWALPTRIRRADSGLCPECRRWVIRNIVAG
jgi:hypothetical protein